MNEATRNFLETANIPCDRCGNVLCEGFCERKYWEKTPPERARYLVFDLINNRLKEENPNPHPTFSLDEVYLVWFCYILGGWKALISTSLPYEMYYEVTHNIQKNETYIDVYKKVVNYLV